MKARKSGSGNIFHLDYFLLFICTSLLIIGYIMVVSSTMHLNGLQYPVKQLVHIVIGLIVGIAVTLIPLKVWEKLGLGMFVAGLALLFLVLIPGVGVEVNGSIRWISLGGLRIQVSEIVKFTSVVYMAGYVTKNQEHVQQSPYGLVRPLLFFSIACFLLIKEPDFGSAVVILVIAMGIMYLAGARLWQFMILFSAVIMLGVLLIYIEPYKSSTSQDYKT